MKVCGKKAQQHNTPHYIPHPTDLSLFIISGDMYNIVPSVLIVPASSDVEKQRYSPKSPSPHNTQDHKQPQQYRPQKKNQEKVHT
jgi:hypothetical protein